MARILSERDTMILKKAAPECTGLACAGSGGPYRSILPPLANHYAADSADFRERLERLDDDDLRYLTGLILDGSESLGCVPPGYIEVFLTFIADRLGRDAALSILQHYESEDGCVP
ncbi:MULTISPECIES: hypothetical protein [unclassified Methanoculleus]|jgi:hypothetical protein|uniref:Uncharacterized protein n=1 Tax=Methanoculleus palmolei TaxID=72612 RepID=A0ABD8A6D9_9EURY|nr:hypothetical protein [Methanoculleus sp. UBA377]MDD2473010.1 hypothetical protein [Methanoculleus sp.]WOX55101.1 hypothetical protein R6Y95_06400 [Methanoculleus palmolei]